MNLKKFNSDYYSLMFFKNGITTIILVLVLCGCTTALYVPTEYDALEQNISLNTLKTGRELYIYKCGSCHNLYLPDKYTRQEWIPIMDKMQKRAKIDSSQKDLILKYIDVCLK